MPVGKVLARQSSRVAQKVASKFSDRDRLTQFLILLAAGCLTTMTGGVVAPVFPEMVQELQLDPRWAGMLVSTHALTSALATPLMGMLADRTSKLRVLLGGLICYAVVGVLTPLMPTLALLIPMRGLLGVTSGAIAAATIGILGSLYEGSQRSRILGYATSTMTTSAILFPLLGGWAGETNWQGAFYLYGLGLPLALVAATRLRVPPTKSDAGIQTDRNSLSVIWKNATILRTYLLVAAAATVVYAVVIYTPLYLKETIGAGPELNGVVLAIRAVGAAVTSAFFASRLAQRFGKRGAIAFGFSLMALTIFTIPFLTHLVWIIPTAILFGVGFGILTPNLYDCLAEVSPPETRTTILAIATGFNSLGQFICPILLGPVWKYIGLSSVFYGAAVLAAIACVVSLAKLQKQPQEA